MTEGQLRSKRDEFWDTAPAFEGRKEIWDALRAAASAFESNDHLLAQAILDGASITLPHGNFVIGFFHDSGVLFLGFLSICMCDSHPLAHKFSNSHRRRLSQQRADDTSVCNQEAPADEMAASWHCQLLADTNLTGSRCECHSFPWLRWQNPAQKWGRHVACLATWRRILTVITVERSRGHLGWLSRWWQGNAGYPCQMWG